MRNKLFVYKGKIEWSTVNSYQEWIFSEIDRPLDFNETFVNSSVLNVVSINDTNFLRKSLLYDFIIILYVLRK